MLSPQSRLECADAGGAGASSATDVLLHVLPLYHVHGLFVACNTALFAGARLLFLPRFDAAEGPRGAAARDRDDGRADLLHPPAGAGGAVAARCAGVRLFVSGSAPLLEQTFRDFEARTGHRILERYGMTETGMNTSNPLHGERRPGTVGLPLPGIEVRVTDEAGRVLGPDEVGVLEVRGPNVFEGYWRMPERTAEEFRATASSSPAISPASAPMATSRSSAGPRT